MHRFWFRDRERAFGVSSVYVTHPPICTLTHTMTDALRVDVDHKHRSSFFLNCPLKLASWLARVDSIDVEHEPGHEHLRGKGVGEGGLGRAGVGE